MQPVRPSGFIPSPASQDRLLRWAPLLLASRPFPAGEPPASAPFDRNLIAPTTWFDAAKAPGSGTTVTLAELLTTMLGSPASVGAVLEQVAANPPGAWMDLELPRRGASAVGPVQISAFHRLLPAGEDEQILLAWYGQRLPQVEAERHGLHLELEGARRVLASLEGALRVERGKVETLLEAARGPASIQDTAYRIQAQNEAHRELFGERRGASCYEVYRARTEPCPACPMQEALRERDGAAVEDRPEQGPLAGQVVQIRALPLYGADHSPMGIVEIFSEPETAAVERDVQVVSAPTRLREHELQHILDVLERSGGNRAQTARLLGISRATLWRRLGPQHPRRSHRAP